jgi:hypothetical protein
MENILMSDRSDHDPERGSSTALPQPPRFVERHFTPQELAELWRLDETTIRRIFQDEPGVLRIGKLKRHDGKRDYVTLRIPESVANRVYDKRTGRAA